MKDNNLLDKELAGPSGDLDSPATLQGPGWCKSVLLQFVNANGNTNAYV